MSTVGSREFNIDVIKRVQLQTELNWVQSYNRSYLGALLSCVTVGSLIGLIVGDINGYNAVLICGSAGAFVGIMGVSAYAIIKSGSLVSRIKAIDDKYDDKTKEALHGKCRSVAAWLSDKRFYDLTRPRSPLEEEGDYYKPILEEMLRRERNPSPTELRSLRPASQRAV